MVEELLDLIIDKQELKGINKEFAKKILDKALHKHPEFMKEFTEDKKRFTKKKVYKELRSEVRKELREVYGVFFTPQYKKKSKAIQALINKPTKEQEKVVLSLHRSTQERISYYDFLYHQLFSITGTPKTVLDIGCGFNPFSYQHLPNRPAYHAIDIACEDLELIDEYLNRLQVTHTTTCKDITEIEAIKALPQADIAFLFKIIDTLETIKPNYTEQLLEAIPAKYIVISFPTLTIGQKNTISSREWFERLITNRLLTTVTLPNEQVYIITSEEKDLVTH